MLTQLHIRDFALIDRLELELGSGLTALTGETGAGKSILIDALGLALGGRGEAGVVRHGGERAEISAAFDITGLARVREWLAGQELDEEGECVIRRSISADGRSRGYINGRPVPLQTLQTLGEWLVDIHGQHAHQSLLRRDAQRDILDDYADHAARRQETAERHRRWRELQNQLAGLRQNAAARGERLELLRYQLNELEALDVKEGEFAAIEEDHARLANASRLIGVCQHALHTVYEGDEAALTARLGQILRELEGVLAHDARLAHPLQLLGEAGIQLREAAHELRRYVNDLEDDPARLREVETRMAELLDAARKHHVQPAELPALHERLAAELRELEHADETLDELDAQLRAAAVAYRECAAELSARRARAAERLAKQVSAGMQTLGMPGGRFAVSLTPRAEDDFSPAGMEEVEFQVSANPGQPLKPLTKVASGGELSRISLAIQVIAAKGARVPTLIFDEVDVGIGGGVAEIVGRQLRALGGACQVLCVTHLAQVAAQGHHHLRVVKTASRGATHIRITPLTEDERREEIARMLGGVEITAQTRAHAEEMLARSREAVS